ncbi:phenylalanine--tRNA ligase subunit beta [Leptolyngbya sp. 7M]|uniref:phenylalanine--tRNA ligase subunit beta n=1 Tax=Leptolyngbya sp. 7M TaxID=2812896 RepID=UPI001B8B572C|nr:phenylalanine--tRNA ligase subunit beta [Leptolyngbya sp. 7M]QYO65544.1 phenylalanine--tRNA ligase subunit beta [Leptolyngbya sp. 7M]
MNISFNWLKELINIRLSAEETAKALTRVGLAVEGIHPHKDDLILDIDLTSNRPDCLSHRGVARELQAITGDHLGAETQRSGVDASSPTVDAIPYPAALAAEFVQIENPELCHRFTARIIKDVKIGPSPQWLIDRLEALGERSINNVADITNYVMLELGQPMHAFDLDKLAENRIIVRTARPGETIKTLDEVDRKLDETMLAICDAEKPVAIAGVMGGFDSGITESTINVLLEVAYFKRESIRATSRKLNLATEASYRFERGVDINNLIRASNRATELICELAGGTADSIIDTYPTHAEVISVSSPDISSATKRLTGLEVSLVECSRILSALGIEEEPNKDKDRDLRSAVFSVPSWRYDVALEEDLVEEIARHFGYENIKDELPPAYGAGEYQPTEDRERRIRTILSDLGFDEALSYSFIDAKYDGRFELIKGLVNDDLSEPFVTLRDSVIEGAVRMRPTLLPGLLEAVRLNFNHQRRDLGLFEIGKTFFAVGDGGLPKERKLFTMVITGSEIFEGRETPGKPVDFYDIKGALEAALSGAGVFELEYRPDEIQHLQNGQSASVWIHGSQIGSIGRLNEEICSDYKFKQAIYVAEIDLEAVLSQKADQAIYTPLPRFPAIVRDVSFAVSRGITFADIRDAALSERPEILEGVGFVDIYEGKGIDDDKRSLTIRFIYRSHERTLAETDVDSVHSERVALIEKMIGIRQRF